MKYLIVGGGIVGITGAILLREKGYEVTVLEKSTKLGGLLNSFEAFKDNFLDFGSHVPRETGIEELDRILFGNLLDEQWNKYSYADVGNYFCGKLNTSSSFIDVRQLEEEIFIKGKQDFFKTNKKSENNLIDGLKAKFGETFTFEIYLPLMKKLLGDIDFSEIEATSYNLFGYTRLIIANQSETEKIKQDIFFDQTVAHTQNNIGYSGKKIYYPKKTGIYKWINSLEQKARDLGVIFRFEEHPLNILMDRKTIHTSKSTYRFDKMIWTLPKEILDSTLDETYVIPQKKFIGVNVFHYKYQGELLIKNHYLYCNDVNLSTFRVTLYDNLTQDKTNCCTVEVLGNEIYDSELIFQELKIMGIFSEDTKNIDFKKIYIKNGFPIPYTEKDNTKELCCIGKDVILLNKDAQNFFMEDLLIRMYCILNEETSTSILN